jgi:hypothetical protein
MRGSLHDSVMRAKAPAPQTALAVAKGSQLAAASLSASVKSGRDVINFGCRFYPASGHP